jgi:hypothetical protein
MRCQLLQRLATSLKKSQKGKVIHTEIEGPSKFLRESADYNRKYMSLKE